MHTVSTRDLNLRRIVAIDDRGGDRPVDRLPAPQSVGPVAEGAGVAVKDAACQARSGCPRHWSVPHRSGCCRVAEWGRDIAAAPPSKNRTGQFPVIRLKPLKGPLKDPVGESIPLPILHDTTRTPVHVAVESRTSSILFLRAWICRHLHCPLRRFIRPSRAEPPEGSLLVFTPGQRGPGGPWARIRRVTRQPSLSPSSFTRTTFSEPCGFLTSMPMSRLPKFGILS
jgi:hypothetical protein